MNVLHVVPVDDLIDHDTMTEEPVCVCGPVVQWVDCGEKSDGWLIVHASLDGREVREGPGFEEDAGGRK